MKMDDMAQEKNDKSEKNDKAGRNGGRAAILSNVNMNFVIRMLSKDLEVYEAEGYGNELGILMNPASSYYAFAPELTFMILDLMEVLDGELETDKAQEKVEDWFDQMETSLKLQAESGTGAGSIYYISDAYLWGVETSVLSDTGKKQELEQIWQVRLQRLCEDHTNVRIFPYRHMIEKLGEDNAFSLKMWYMGRILLSSEAQKELCGLILHYVRLESHVPKKVLLLDLDNTLWGGLAGEAEHTPVVLSSEHGGLAYKNLQKVVRQMQRQGVLLGIVSKNNEEDAMEMIEKHPHMVLEPEDFAAKRINWKPKHENIKEIAEELNLGMDSFVFFDDDPKERQLVKEMLSEVTVPDFPKKPEELAPAMAEIYQTYFAKSFVTKEDREKTRQYAENAKRTELKNSAGSFGEYLHRLEIVMQRVDAQAGIERLTQLLNKTNQFNLTTIRHTQGEIQQILSDPGKRVYLYQVRDRFGDNGQVAAVIVDLSQEVPVIAEFVMSCRVMGKKIEDAIIDDVEQEMLKEGYTRIRGRYLPSAKNKPVKELYPGLGYLKVKELSGGGAEYEIEIAEAPERVYYVEIK